MKNYGTEHKRLINQWYVHIKNHRITITGNYYSNNGLIYGHAVCRWINGADIQIIGFDSGRGLTKQVLAYIYAYIRKYHKQLAE